MATMDEVLAMLRPEEIDYDATAATLGPDALPFLLEIARGGDRAIAPQAIYLASLLQPSGSVDPVDVVRVGLESDDVLLRLAAASAIANLSDPPAETIGLLADADPSVRKVALRSIAANPIPGARDAVLALVDADPESFVRDLAADVAERLA